MAYQPISGKIIYPTPHYYASVLSPTNQAIDAADEKCAFLFIAPKTGNIRKVHYRVTLYTSTATLDVRLETVNATTGYPSGTLWGTNTNVADAPTATGWRVCTLTADAAVTKGQEIYIVVSQPSSSPGNLRLGYYLGNAKTYPRAAQFGGGSWGTLVANEGGAAAIEYDDGSFAETEGLLPWKENNTTTFNNNSTPNHVGLRFSLPVAAKLSGFAIYMNIPNGKSATVKLYDSNGATVLKSVVLDGDVALAAQGVWTREFDAEVGITPNTFYRLVVAPNETTTAAIVYRNEVHTAAMMGAYGLGQNGHLTTATNPAAEGDWTQTLAESPMFSLTLSAFDDAAASLFVNAGMTGGMKG